MNGSIKISAHVKQFENPHLSQYLTLEECLCTTDFNRARIIILDHWSCCGSKGSNTADKSAEALSERVPGGH